MSSLAIVLVVFSAFLHASWNLVSKSRHPSAAFFLVSSFTGAVLLSPALLLSRDVLLHGIPSQVWLLLLGTSFFMALYYIALAGAYRAGDISVAYPLARSSPVIVVAIVALLLGRGDQVSGLCLAGILLVVGGCFLVPLQRFGELRPGNYLNRTCGLALLAAIGTSGYSIADDEALRILRTDSALAAGNTQLTMLYACLQAFAASCWLSLFVVTRRAGRSDLRGVLANGKRYAVPTGMAIHVTYLIVLIALAYVNNVSYVVGLRQLSIPLGAILGILVLHETAHRPKIIGVAIMFAGLVLVALG